MIILTIPKTIKYQKYLKVNIILIKTLRLKFIQAIRSIYKLDKLKN